MQELKSAAEIFLARNFPGIRNDRKLTESSANPRRFETHDKLSNVASTYDEGAKDNLVARFITSSCVLSAYRDCY